MLIFGHEQLLCTLESESLSQFQRGGGTLRNLTPALFDGAPENCEEAVSTAVSMLANVVIGACIRMTNKEDVRKLTHAASKKGSKLRFSKIPQACDYVIGGEIQIDCVQHVRDVCAGREIRSHKVQWLVRGHYRNQAHGKNRESRRRQWIEPHWKGEEVAPILIRSHTMPDPERM